MVPLPGEPQAALPYGHGTRAALASYFGGIAGGGGSTSLARIAMIPAMEFHSTVELGGKTATGIALPDDVVAALGAGRRPAVRLTVGGHTYRTTVASMGGRFLVPLSAENRAAAGVAAGDKVDVTVELDTEPRDVEVPDDLSAALAGDDAARRMFEVLAFSHRKEWVRWVTESKRAETRARRVAQAVESLRAGKRTH